MLKRNKTMKKNLLPIALSLFLLSSGCAGQVRQSKDDKSVQIKGNKRYVDNARARWISTDIITLPFPKDQINNYTFHLYYSPFGNITIANYEIANGKSIELETNGFFSEKDSYYQKYPYLKDQLKISTAKINKDRVIPELIRGNLLLVIKDKAGKIFDATQLQTYGLLDQIYTYNNNDLGITYSRYRQPTLKLWAPTAKSVKIYFYKNPHDTVPEKVREMEEVREQGIWKITGNESWVDKYYLYEVEVYSPLSGNLETNLVTDPYSIGLSANGKKSRIIDFNDRNITPSGWDYLKKPDSNENMSIYELHVRDFSIKDQTVNEQNRGKFLAFTEKKSNGMKHLTNLQKAGLTHIHLLPVTDMSSIEEIESDRKEVKPTNLQANSSLQQQMIGSVRKKDGYNWGYDPMHFLALEGSYSTNPNSNSRILEFRQAVKSLNEQGLKVIMDVVYNHTSSTGQDKNSVLDKVVPAYYYRLDNNGKIQNSTCCPDTATEHNMMEKLMIDSLVNWAKNYKVDGFRFDLMGHHTVENIKNARQALDQLTYDKDGIDGKKIYLYGEGWKFGSLNDILPDRAMYQQNSAGSGVGTFNDRFRDSVRGGSFMSKNLTDQGFATGLYNDYNQIYLDGDVSPEPMDQKDMMYNLMDNIKLGLSGNLRNYKLKTKNGIVKGSNIKYHGIEGSGYTLMPKENVVYVDAHDNHTLWDLISAKAPYNTPVRLASRSRDAEGVRTASVSEKVKMQNMSIGLVALSQGVPFFHAGDDMLRSKSGDGDSYDSGDWFNSLDFTYNNNNWGVGLPPEWRNKSEWNFWQSRLANPKMKVSRNDILTNVVYMQRMLKVRSSSPLFNFKSEKEIVDNITFLDLESYDRSEDKYTISQTPGFIAMNITDKTNIDTKRKSILVLFNASNQSVEFSNRVIKDKNLKIHNFLTDNINIDINGESLNFAGDTEIKKSVYNKQMGSITIEPMTTVVYQELE